MIPLIEKTKTIGIICEGNEEVQFVNRLTSLHLFSNDVTIIPMDAKGNGNIYARFDYYSKLSRFDEVLIMCDTEKKPYDQFETILDKLEDEHNIHNYNDVLIFSNPMTMLLFLNNFEKIDLTTKNKQVIKSHIKRLTGIADYNKTSRKIDALMTKITADSFQNMLTNIQHLSTDYHDRPSTNFLAWFRKLS